MVVNATFVANHLLVEDEAYVGMLADKVNANEPMQSIRDSLIEYVKNNYWFKPLAGAYPAFLTFKGFTMTREQLTNLYMVWVNDFLTIGGFADYFGLTDNEAEMLLAVARSAYENPHPEA